MNRGSTIWWSSLLAGLLVFACACAVRDGAALRDDLHDDQRRMMWTEAQAPVFSATEMLSVYLPRSDVAVRRFTLTVDGARPLTGDLSTADLCSGERAVFFHLAAGGEESAWWYFSPHDAVFVQVTADFTIVRLMDGKKRVGVLYQFRLDGDDITAASSFRLEEPSLREAVVTSDQSAIVVLTAGNQSEMVAWTLKGTRLRSIDLPADSAPAGLFALPNGTVACAVGKEGERRLIEIDVGAGQFNEWTAEQGNAAVSPFILASAGLDNPVVLQLPEHIDQATLLALVAARNPAINRRRALLVAALAEEGSLTVRPLPTLQLGADYTLAEGIFLDPLQAAGDVLSEGLVRGLIGLVRPIFDRSRRVAAAEAGSIRATIAGDLLAEEISHQTAEASREWVQFHHLSQRLAIHEEMVALAEAQYTRHKRRVAEGLASVAEGLQWQAEREAAVAAVAADQRTEAALVARLRRRCGLPVSTNFHLQRHERLTAALASALPSAQAAEQVGLMNRSRFLAAQALTEEAFFQHAATRGRPTAAIGARYGHVRQDDGAAVTDYISTFIQAEIPLSRASRRLDDRRAAALVEAQRAATADAAAEVRERVNTAWLRASAARERHAAAVAEVAWRAESARVAGIWSDTGGPHLGQAIDAAALAASRKDLLLAQQRLADRSAEVFLTTIDMQEEMGAGREQYLRVLRETSAKRSQGREIATWLWDGALVQEDPQVVLQTLRAAACTRLYLAIGGSGELLADESRRSALLAFISSAQTAGVEVFALLGEPDWLTGAATPALAFARLSAINNRAHPSGPGFSGIKFDLEPHALAEWEDPQQRPLLIERWFDILDSSRDAFPTLPVWVDVHPDCIATPGLASRVAGATIMVYIADRERSIERARLAAASWPKPFEIGIELRAQSPPAEKALGSLTELCAAFAAAFSERIDFTGVAVHDFTGLSPAQGAKLP